MSIQSEINRIGDGVDDIKAAITEKGGTIPESAKVNDLGDIVRNLPSGTGGITQEEADKRYIKSSGETNFSGIVNFNGGQIDWTNSSGDKTTFYSGGMWNTKKTSADNSVGVHLNRGLLMFFKNKKSTFELGYDINKDNAFIFDITDDSVESIIAKTIGNILFPVNIIIPFSDDEDHSSWLGLTWERCLQDKFPRGAGNLYNAGATGGNSMIWLETDQVPPLASRDLIASNGGSNGRVTGYSGSRAPSAIDITPPYECVSYWRRTA